MPRSFQQMEAHEAKLDRFADLLSRDIPIPRIAESMSIGRGAAHILLRIIRDRLGPQAV